MGYLEQVTGAAAEAVNEASSDAIRLRRALDTLPQGVVICDDHRQVIYRNAPANVLVASRHGDALAAQAVTELLESAWSEGHTERTLDLYGPPRRTLSIRVRQIDDGRRPLGVIAVIEDVSERRRLDEIRRDFVANVSHELKTPMGALGLLAETLVSEPDTEVARRLADRIHAEAFRVSRIIDDLLDLSRIESAEMPARDPVLVNLVMAEAVERVRSAADQRGIEIVLEEPNPPVTVLGDRRQLVSAMHALLENAVNYSYDNSKVVVTGAVHHFNPKLEHPATVVGAPAARPCAWESLPATGEAPAGDGARCSRTPGPMRRRRPGTGGDPGAGHRWSRSSRPRSWSRSRRFGESDVRPPRCARRPTPRRAAPQWWRPAHDRRRFQSHGAGGAAGRHRRASPADPGGGGLTELAHRGARTTQPRSSVQDHGIGIPARDLDRIFERFYRVDHGRSRYTGGTGLGLSIVRHVANNHQGWVDVESREGEGSTFTLVLPIQAERVRRERSPDPARLTGGRARVRRQATGPIKVLLAEDEESFIEALVDRADATRASE